MQLLKEWTTHSFTEADVFCGAIFFLTRKQSTATWGTFRMKRVIQNRFQ